MGVKDGSDDFEFEVEGKVVRGRDRLLDGRQVRTRAGFLPAADFALIEVRDGYLSSVGLEDEIELQRGRRRTFRAFGGGDVFALTVNDVGWEWGAETMPEEDLRRYARIPDDHDLFLDPDGRRKVERGGVRLDPRGTERVYSRARGRPTRLRIVFVINGEDIEAKAFPDDVLRDVLAKALKDSENTGQPADAWEVRTEAGQVLDAGLTLEALDLEDGLVLVASLRTGAAG